MAQNILIEAAIQAWAGTARRDIFALIFVAVAMACLFGAILPEANGQGTVRRSIPSAGSDFSSRDGKVTVARAVPVRRSSPEEVAATPAPIGSTSSKGTAGSESVVPLPNTMGGLNERRQLSIGDRISFSVAEDEAPPHQLIVTDSGEVDFPYVGRVSVTNKTCKSLAYYLKGLLEKEFYYQATVLIGLDSMGGREASRGRLYVMGQVGRPGPVEIPADEVLTVSKAIMRAGGFGQYANKKGVKVTKATTSKGGGETVIVNLVDVLDKGMRAKDIEVGPEDWIQVPEKWINF